LVVWLFGLYVCLFVYLFAEPVEMRCISIDGFHFIPYATWIEDFEVWLLSNILVNVYMYMLCAYVCKVSNFI